MPCLPGVPAEREPEPDLPLQLRVHARPETRVRIGWQNLHQRVHAQGGVLQVQEDHTHHLHWGV